jgi:hypothetical protein
MSIFVVLIGSLLSVVSSERSLYVGCQSNIDEWGAQQGFVVAGMQLGRWEGWVGIGPDFEVYQRPADTSFYEQGTIGWWEAQVHSGIGWVQRDSGFGETVGLQANWMSFGSSKYTSSWPSEFLQIDALWGIAYRQDKLRLDIAAGPTFLWIHNAAFEWRLNIHPTLNLRISRVW